MSDSQPLSGSYPGGADGKAALFAKLASQRATGAGAHCSATSSSQLGSGCSSRCAANDGARLSVALGGHSRSCRAAQGSANNLAGTSTDALPDGGSGGTTDRAADRRFRGAVGSNRVRQQQTAAEANNPQHGSLHVKLLLTI
jgi:hypothetical protein